MKHEVKKVNLENIKDDARLLLDMLSIFMPRMICAEFMPEEFKDASLQDIIATVVDYNAYNEYRESCAPSAAKWLNAVAILAAYAYYEGEGDDEFADDVMKGLGYFIVTNDARSFAHLEKYLNIA
jgi:hypothetical protein